MTLDELNECIKPFLTRAFVEGRNMTAQEILEGVCRHRANPVASADLSELRRKHDEIEWALQAIAEKLVDLESVSSQPVINPTGHA